LSSNGRIMLDINDWVNTNIKYLKDKPGDHWQTLAETIKLGTGDCEDFVIAKKFLAMERGIPEAELIMVYCLADTVAHMVLYWNGIIYDNRNLCGKLCTHTDIIPYIGYTLHTSYIVTEWQFIEHKIVNTKIQNLIERHNND